MTRRPVPNPPARLRQRRRADGTWRVWWEPEAAVRAMGFAPVELDAGRPTWSAREAERLNAAVSRARAGGPAPKARKRTAERRTIAALIDRFLARPDYLTAYRPATRRDYEAAFRLIRRRWGATPVAAIAKADVREWWEQLWREAGAHQATALVRKMSVLMAYAEAIGWIADGANPCLRLRLTEPGPRQRLATWDELAALLAACRRPVPGTGGRPAYSVGAGIVLAAFMGQRETDILAARPEDFEGSGATVPVGTWRVLRSKRQTHGAIAPHRVAAPWVRLAARQARRAAAAKLLVYEGTGKPYSEDLFRRAFARVRAAAATRCPSVASLQFRDLRRTAGHLARLGRASERDVADLLGNTAWKDPKLSGTYMPVTAETAARAVAAIRPPAGFTRAIRGAV